MAQLSEITLDMAVDTNESKLNHHIARLSKMYFEQHLDHQIKSPDSVLNNHIESIFAIAIDSIVKENMEIKKNAEIRHRE